MNNTIIELLNEATSGHVEERDSSRVRTVSLDEMEKFAELIVAECVDIADDYVKDYCVEEHIKFNHPRSKIGLKIKEHFGIENKENT
jgi:hypothetical protein